VIMLAVASVAAAPAVAESTAQSAAPGAVGFLVVAGLGLALFFLFRSMTKHLRKVRLAADSTGADSTGADSTAPGVESGRVSTGAAATDVAANKESGGPGA
jgi:hypothetical protein